MITANCDRQIGRDFVQKTFTISPWLLCLPRLSNFYYYLVNIARTQTGEKSAKNTYYSNNY